MKSNRLSALFAIYLFLLPSARPAPAQSASPPASARPSTAPSYPETKDGLKQYFTDVLSIAATRDPDKLHDAMKVMRLPDAEAWFGGVFDDANVPSLLADYNKTIEGFPEAMTVMFLKFDDPKSLSVEITTANSLDDSTATAYQRFLLSIMRRPVTLYTAQITKPGTKSGLSLWSLVYVDGSFRFIGKLRSVKDSKPIPNSSE